MADTTDHDLLSGLGVASCFNAQTFLGTANEYNNGELNPDIGGGAVAIANIVISVSVTLSVLVTSSTDVTPYVFLFFTQSIPILLSTLMSVHSQNLSLFDAHFTLAVTASPISLFIASSCLLHFCGIRTSLFQGLTPRSLKEAILLWLGLALLPLWFTVSIITSFSTKSFRNSDLCRGMSFYRYLEFVIASSMSGVLDVMGRRDLIDDLQKRQALGLVSLICLLCLSFYVVRNKEQIIRDWRGHHRDLIREDLWFGGAPPMRRLIRRYLLLAWYVPKVCWDVIREHHFLLMIWILVVLHWSWIASILHPVRFDRRELSYGQIFSILSATPSLFALIGIIRPFCNWTTVRMFFSEAPGFITEGLYFVKTGNRNQIGRLPVVTANRATFQWSRKWVIIVSGWLAAIGLDVLWIWSYVKTGTRPYESTPLNTPHSNWKPFSIMLYIYGYVLSVASMLICMEGFDYYRAYRVFVSNSKIRRTFDLTVPLLIGFLVVAPFFTPFAALPLAQGWVWDHECESFPTSILLKGQSNPNISSTISFYTVPSQSQLGGQPYLPIKRHVYSYDFFKAGRYKILQYRLADDNTTLPQELEPSIKTMFLDVSKREFFGCSSKLTQLMNVTDAAAICANASGTYSENPYLFFSFNSRSPSERVFVRTQGSEYGPTIDAPSFILRFAAANGTLSTGPILLRSAITKRNEHSLLLVCSNSMSSPEILGPLALFLMALDRYTFYVNLPRVYSI